MAEGTSIGSNKIQWPLAILFLAVLLCIEDLVINKSQAAEQGIPGYFETLRLSAESEEIARIAFQFKSSGSKQDEILLDSLDESIQDYDLIAKKQLESGTFEGAPLAKKMFDRAYKALPVMKEFSQRARNGTSTTSDLELIGNWITFQKPALLQATKALQDSLVPHKARVLFFQSTVALVTTSLVFFGCLLIYRINIEKLRALLRVTREKKKELRARIEELEEVHRELNVVKLAYEETKNNFEKSKQEIEIANEIMKRANHRFRELFAGMPIACLTTNTRGEIYEWNREAEKLFRLNPGSTYLASSFELLPNKDSGPTFMEAIQNVGTGGEMVDGFKWKTGEAFGEEIHVFSRMWPMKTVEGTITGIVMACYDQSAEVKSMELVEKQLIDNQVMNITLEIQAKELQYVNKKLEDLATTDGLTGLKNHRTFQAFLRDGFDQWMLNQEELSLILLDIDHFKSFNDTFGHQAGDEVLKLFARITQLNCPDPCLAARYGGEEFAVVCPGMDEKEATAFAEKLRVCIESHTWPFKPVTTSLGVSSCNSQAENPAQLVAQADQALYSSKHNGRNQVTTFSQLQKDAA